MTLVRVALDLPIDRSFDFLAPGADENDVGRLAVVPFGSRELAGVIVAIGGHSDVPADKLKPVLHVQRELPAFGAREFALFRFCESYYHHPFGPIALNALPPAMRATRPVSPRTERWIALSDTGRAALATLPARAAAQRQMLAALTESPQAESAVKARHERAAQVLKTLLTKGWVEIAAAAPESRAAPADFPAGLTLNAEQAAAVSAIVDASTADSFTPWLLQGVTGSGKTEVYLRAIADTLTRGRQALVLLPEINLTPQFMRRLAERFPGANIVEQHSGLAALPRMTGYLDAQSGRADVVVGTRLAVFTPMPRLGLIVVDEEHDASFKQQEGFRYSARDVAVFRAQQADCPVVLGSATPSLETLHNVERGRFRALLLTRRAVAQAALPRVDFIDLNHERAEDGLSASLTRAIDDTVRRGEQALVFINRRGYSPALVCAQCGAMPECARCAARLVFHQRERRLKCHHCGYQSRVPPTCKSCGSHELVPAGQGTERVELALQKALPTARIARVDRDSTRRRGAAERIFDAAAAGEVDVLVGTQMLAKGHDFPRITLVGVVNADGAIFSADFRAAERMAAQLMQVAGRAGRAERAGRVLVQTRFATHPLYQAVAQHDYARFAALAMDERRVANLPPFAFLALLRAESRAREAVDAFMARTFAAATEIPRSPDVHVWDPVPAMLSRKAGFERRQLMIQADSRKALQQFLSSWLPVVHAHDARAVKWIIDVDPQDV